MRDHVTNLEIEAETTPLRKLRRVFYQKVLPAIPVEPREDLENLCKAWLDATGAGWVWLWLQYEENGEKRPWELTAIACREGKREHFIPTLREFVSIKSPESTAEFVSGLEKPIFVENIETWRGELNGQIHKVIALPELKERYCKSFLSVPLIFQKHREFGDDSKLRGLVCSHFLEQINTEELQDEYSYMLMGHATASAIVASFFTKQYRVLVEMDAVATKYLTKGGRVEENRKDYLETVIDLIKRYLQVKYVSFFYKTMLNDDLIECIASTGLYLNGGGDLLPKEDYSSLRYRKNEGLTGYVYATGVPYISQIGQTPARPNGVVQCKSSERENDNPGTYGHSWVCYPISTTVLDPDVNEKSITQIVGVLRCNGNKSILHHTYERNFDPIQIKTLDFIVSQLAPVLETMAIHIKRERYITIIKHDLYNPLRLLDAGVEAITDQVEDRFLPRNWENKMKFSLAMARNLAGGLSEKESFRKTPTSLVGDVLTPLMSGLRYYAQVENNMTLWFDDNIKQFPKLNLDHELVERAFLNIVVNAIKYGNRGTDIKIIGQVTGEDYRLHVSNEGCGVDEGEQDKIFIGEYRSPKVKNLKQGLGLGLKIARAAMERNGGRLLLTNSRNPTTFTMVFEKW